MTRYIAASPLQKEGPGLAATGSKPTSTALYSYGNSSAVKTRPFSRDELDKAKDLVGISDAWRALGLPGEPKRHCKSPFRDDRHPSFSICENDRLWIDRATGEKGDVVSFVEIALGSILSEAILRVRAMAGQDVDKDRGWRVPPRRSNLLSSRPRAPKNLPRYTARLGTAHELDSLAKLRGLSCAKGLDHMQSAGCLSFADDLNDVDEDGQWHPAKTWLICDPTGRNVSARRLDGLPWRCCCGAKSRCVSGSGSKHWPVGITLAKPGQRLDVVEGDGDFLALWHLHALAGCQGAAPVGLLTGKL